MLRYLLIIIYLLIFPIIGKSEDQNKTLNYSIYKIVEITNADRVKNGKPELKINNELVLSAKTKAMDMYINDYFEHNSPAGVTFWHWIKMTDYDYAHAGENLAIDFIYLEDMQKAFMNSEGHKENILSDNYTEIGVAILNSNIVIHFGSK